MNIIGFGFLYDMKNFADRGSCLICILWCTFFHIIWNQIIINSFHIITFAHSLAVSGYEGMSIPADIIFHNICYLGVLFLPFLQYSLGSSLASCLSITSGIFCHFLQLCLQWKSWVTVLQFAAFSVNYLKMWCHFYGYQHTSLNLVDASWLWRIIWGN